MAAEIADFWAASDTDASSAECFGYEVKTESDRMDFYFKITPKSSPNRGEMRLYIFL